MNGMIVAVISAQALIRNQNHQAINNKPSPAPHSMMNSHTPLIDFTCVVTPKARIIIPKVTHRLTRTIL